MRRRVRLELLLGAVVRDDRGETVGRIQELRLARRDGRLEVVEVLLGPLGLMRRLSISLRSFPLVRRLLSPRDSGLRVPVGRLDFSRPRAPRLRAAAAEIRGRAAAPEIRRDETAPCVPCTV